MGVKVEEAYYHPHVQMGERKKKTTMLETWYRNMVFVGKSTIFVGRLHFGIGLFTSLQVGGLSFHSLYSLYLSTWNATLTMEFSAILSLLVFLFSSIFLTINFLK